MLEPAIYLIVSLVMSVIFAYFCYLAWFRYQIFLKRVKNFQNTLQRAGFPIPKYYEQIPNTRMYKWLARLVFLFMFSLSSIVLLLTIYGLLIR